MKLIRLLLLYLGDFARANLAIARQVVTPGLNIEPKVIEMETRVKSDPEILALSNLITFTPGSLTLNLEPEGKLVVHVLDESMSNAEDLRKRLEEPLLEVTRGS